MLKVTGLVLREKLKGLPCLPCDLLELGFIVHKMEPETCFTEDRHIGGSYEAEQVKVPTCATKGKRGL